ncbi:toprim domain-containing protein [Nocardioides sp. J2M5]|uniref:toprim domain-containing protein n=1 Tax=Nocardioides palaemonis TaxID=2829810 RepID=UPI001BA98C36|nr:toprim domain-containing protein [Nocardioides palaemonis]MBS2936866.1 toprim domain-containing protein [Nocardioides palaemonis]
MSRSKSAKLPSLVEPDAGDAELLGMVVGHYAEALAGHSDALAFLARRRIDDPEAIEAFRIGFGDRTLGYRIPHSRTADGARVRGRLRDLGVIKTSGHEHFRGCLTFPILDAAGQVGEVYGRRLDPHATPQHLYLPGPHRGVWNPAGFEAEELIICESIIDALTLWCAGFRHVTAAYGVYGWTPDHQQALVEHGIKRTLIAFDGDDAGDRGAKALAAELTDAGVEVFRVELPRGSDVNDVAVEAKNAQEALGRYLRKAAWMGGAQNGRPSSPRVEVESVRVVPPGLDSPAHTVEPVEPAPVVAPDEPDESEGSVDPSQVVGRELLVEFAERRWRVRGLDKVTSFDVLRVNLLVTVSGQADGPSPSSGSGFHVDTLDLYSARARAAFVVAARRVSCGWRRRW